MPEDLAREFEPTARLIGIWVAQAGRAEGKREAAPPAALTMAERDELARLRRENKQLRLERDILSKAAASPERAAFAAGFARGNRDAARLFRLMGANQAVFPVAPWRACSRATLASALGVSKAGYYAWLHRPLSAHDVADIALLGRVRTVHASSRRTYGTPRIHADPARSQGGLRGAQGGRHGRKRIARLMRDAGEAGTACAGLVGTCRRRDGPATTQRDKEARPAPDLVGPPLHGVRAEPAMGCGYDPPADCGGVPALGCRAGRLEPQARRGASV